MPSKRFKKLPKKTIGLAAEALEKLLLDVKKNCTTKFDESIDLSFQINNKQKKGEVNIRTVVNLPGGTGKKVKVAVVCEDSKSKEAEEIATQKMKDLNAHDLEQAVKIIAGSARSMGIEVKE